MIGRLTIAQVEILANILDNAGQVVLATVVVPFLFGLVKIRLFMLISGLMVTALFWYFSMRLSRKE